MIKHAALCRGPLLPHNKLQKLTPTKGPQSDTPGKRHAPRARHVKATLNRMGERREEGSVIQSHYFQTMAQRELGTHSMRSQNRRKPDRI